MSAPNPYFLKLTETETLRFLDLYQKEEILWNSNLEMYRNRQARLVAAERVAKVLNVRGFTAEYVLIKFKNLRSSYCQELKKVAESISSGAEEIYRPKVFWFHKMNAFLRPFVQSRAAQSNLYFGQPDSNDVQTQEVCTTHFMDVFHHPELVAAHSAAEPQFLSSWESYDEHSQGRSEKRLYPESSTPPPNFSKRAKPSDDANVIANCNIVSDSGSDKFQGSNLNLSQTNQEDSFECFGRYVASLLRAMSPQQSCKLQLEIITKLLSEQINHSNASDLVTKSQQTESECIPLESISTIRSDSVKEENNSNGYVDLTSEINNDS